MRKGDCQDGWGGVLLRRDYRCMREGIWINGDIWITEGVPMMRSPMNGGRGTREANAVGFPHTIEVSQNFIGTEVGEAASSGGIRWIKAENGA